MKQYWKSNKMNNCINKYHLFSNKTSDISGRLKKLMANKQLVNQTWIIYIFDTVSKKKKDIKKTTTSLKGIQSKASNRKS